MGIWLLMPKIRSRLIVALTLLFLISNVNAQRSAIDTYAITNARIVTVSGPVIERGTVVIRNGLIAAVGANVNAPPDARIIDGTGLTVYPGLIDSYTDLALPEASPAPSPGGRRWWRLLCTDLTASCCWSKFDSASRTTT